MRGNSFLVRVLCLSAALMCFSGVTSPVMAQQFKCMEMEFEDVRSMAQEGNEDAQFCLANLYYVGRVVDQNILEAEKIYAKLAEKGHAGALNQLAGIYLKGAFNVDGQGVPKNEEKGIALLIQAAEAGNLSAISNVASRYSSGIGVPLDFDKAVEFYTITANKGDVSAALSLAHLYMEGHSIADVPPFPVNKKKALFWYEKAAELGSSMAQRRVNEMKGLSPDTNTTKKKVKTIKITTALEKEDFLELYDFYQYIWNDKQECQQVGFTQTACSCELEDEYLEMNELLHEAAENHPEWVGASLNFEGKRMHTGEPEFMEGHMVDTNITVTWRNWEIELENFMKLSCSSED